MFIGLSKAVLPDKTAEVYKKCNDLLKETRFTKMIEELAHKIPIEKKMAEWNGKVKLNYAFLLSEMKYFMKIFHEEKDKLKKSEDQRQHANANDKKNKLKDQKPHANANDNKYEHKLSDGQHQHDAWIFVHITHGVSPVH
jgi:hypothetical protein